MVVFGVVCVQMLPMRKIILSNNQVIFFIIELFLTGCFIIVLCTASSEGIFNGGCFPPVRN